MRVRETVREFDESMRQLSWLPGFLFLSWSESPRRGTPTLCLLSSWSVVLSGLFLVYEKLTLFPLSLPVMCYGLSCDMWCVYMCDMRVGERMKTREMKSISLSSLLRRKRGPISLLSHYYITHRENRLSFHSARETRNTAQCWMEDQDSLCLDGWMRREKADERVAAKVSLVSLSIKRIVVSLNSLTLSLFSHISPSRPRQDLERREMRGDLTFLSSVFTSWLSLSLPFYPK